MKQEIVDICRLIYEKGYSVANEGNVSIVRPLRDIIYITPMGKHKGFLKEEDISLINIYGTPLHLRDRENARPSSEWRMHAAIYKKRKDVRAIIHAHAPYVIARASSLQKGHRRQEEGTTGEKIAFVKAGIASSTQELADAVAEKAIMRDAIVIVDHGIVTVGVDVISAFTVLEEVEKLAYLDYLMSGG